MTNQTAGRTTLRESVKSRLNDSQRVAMRRIINAFRSIYLEPVFSYRRASVDRRLPLPDGRKWGSSQPYDLLRSIQTGSVNYRYRDIPMLKHPMEIALYMRLIWQIKPRTIFEVGSFAGGAAVWMGDLLNTFSLDTKVISIDLKVPMPVYQPSNVTFLRGDANSLDHTLTDDLLAKAPRPWLVIEDASHHCETTLAVLRFFDRRMMSGEYIVVEDGTVTQMGHDYTNSGSVGHAITQFLQERGDNYLIDPSFCDFYGPNVTGNPNGYLRKK